MLGCLVSFILYYFLWLHVQPTAGSSLTVPILSKPKKYLNGGSIPLTRRENTAIGTGDAADLLYSARFQVGTTIVDLQLDTGSSDLWSISTACTALSCPIHFNTSRISFPIFNRTKAVAQYSYGDADNLAFTSGPIVSGAVLLADFLVENQFIVAANATNTSLASEGISGVFGLGFPFGNASPITNQLLQRMIPKNTSLNGVTDILLSILALDGPMLPRLTLSGQLDEPLFTITLQRTANELGGNVGELSIGELPGNLSDSSLTYLPVRLYSPDEGGIPGPSSNPSATYPLNWEVQLDSVWLNGQELPLPSNLPGIYTALIDSGSSSLAGPEDVVSSIYSAIASKDSSNNGVPHIDCDTPINLTFVFGGKSFPVDSRDFLGLQQDPEACRASSLTVAPAPTQGRLASWVLGTPFFKSNLIAFRYGDLLQPSINPPQIGFLSTVPDNADQAYASDFANASSANQFFATTISAPTATFAATLTDSVGVGQAPTVGPAITGAAIPGNSAGDDSDEDGPTLSQKNSNAALKWSDYYPKYYQVMLSIFAFLFLFR